jgi:hypothetical protein
MSRTQALFTAVLVASAFSLGALSAHASATFPEALRKKLGLTAIVGPAPGCRLCHKDDVGGLNTATKPFARSLRSVGAMATSVPSLLDALDTLEGDGTDSDHDGSGDIAELRAGTDPNVAETPDGTPPSATEEIPLPETGCSITRKSALLELGRSPFTLGLIVVAASLLRLRRRR